MSIKIRIKAISVKPGVGLLVGGLPPTLETSRLLLSPVFVFCEIFTSARIDS